MHSLTHDLKFALRTLRRSPGFAAVVVLTLAVGVGATTTMFSVVDQVLLRPLPVPEPERLVSLWSYVRDAGEGRRTHSYPDFRDFQEQSRSFSAMGAYRIMQASLTGREGEPRRLDVGAVSHGFLPMLGSHPILGRGFRPDDDRRGAAPVTVVGERIWRSRFGADPAILEHMITLDGVAHEVIGVVPSGLVQPDEVDVWVPLGRQEGAEIRGLKAVSIVARLAPEVSLAEANEDVEAVARHLSQAHPWPNAQLGARLEPLMESVVGPVRGRLLVLFAAVAFVLLIACANVSNLLLIRAASRSREMATRNALGASRWQLTRQLLGDSILLSLGGALLGLPLAVAGIRLLVHLAADDVPRLATVAIDLRVLGFTLAVAVTTGVLFGLAPVFQTLRSDLFGALRSDLYLDGPGSGRGRRLLVVAEVTLAVVLVTGAGLLLRSFLLLTAVEPGFRTERLLAVGLELPVPIPSGLSGEQAPRTAHFFSQLEERLRAVPGVESVSSATRAPMHPGWGTFFIVASQPRPPRGHEPVASFRAVTPGYFRNLGIPLLRGRTISDDDRGQAPGVVVVNRSFVRAFLEGDPLGQKLNLYWIPGRTEWEIVGVVDDARSAGLWAPPAPEMFFSHAQWATPAMTILIRTRGEPLPLAPAVREAIWGLDPNLPVESVATVRDLLADTLAQRRVLMLLLGGFALVALLLAALGIYGLLAYEVGQRTREVGIRMALGAGTDQVLGLVLRRGMGLTLVGLAGGLAGAAGLTRLLRAQLYEVGATDPLTFAAAALFLALVALVASYVPARRATRVDPIVALHDE